MADEPGTGWWRDAAITVPVRLAELPDGDCGLMIGDVTGYAAFNHLQGDNREHDCGDYGVPAHAEEAIERLALAVQHGHGAIAMVNAGVLWSDPRVLGHGQANHAVTVTGIARDPYDGALQGFYINDSGNGQSGRFVSAHLMTTAFEHTGGFCVVTDAAVAVTRGPAAGVPASG